MQTARIEPVFGNPVELSQVTPDVLELTQAEIITIGRFAPQHKAEKSLKSTESHADLSLLIRDTATIQELSVFAARSVVMIFRILAGHGHAKLVRPMIRPWWQFAALTAGCACSSVVAVVATIAASH